MQRNENSDKDQVSERAGAGYPGWEVGDVEFEIARDPRERQRDTRGRARTKQRATIKARSNTEYVDEISSSKQNSTPLDRAKRLYPFPPARPPIIHPATSSVSF